MNRRSISLWVVALILIMFSFVSSIVNAADSFILVSDVDDTVKISNVLDPVDKIKRAPSELVFAGMPELYRQMLGPDSSKQRLWFLSCSPIFLNHHVKETLTKSKFPKYDLTIRPLDKLSDCKAFKIKNLEGKYAKSGEKFILIGDDTEQDIEVYEKFSAFKPTGQVLAVYIHRIKGENDLKGALPFVTAYDIAMHEFLARRLSEQQAAAVGNAVLASKDKTILPNFQKCPKKYEELPGLPPSLATLKAKIEARLNAVCEGNKKK